MQLDSLTHLVMGHAMGAFATGATPAVQTAAYWGALVGNSLPDIDVPVGYLFGRGWAFHRKFTHTVPGILLLSLAAAALITFAIPDSAYLVTWTWTLTGSVIHVFLDCLNRRGVRPLWPFSSRLFAAGVLFIIDPVILGALALASLGAKAGWTGPDLLRLTYIVVWVYIFVRWALVLYLRRRAGIPAA